MNLDQRLKQVLKLIKENLDATIAFLLALIAGVIGLLGNDKYLLTAICGVLALLALGHVYDRSARKKLMTLVEKLESPDAEAVFKDRQARYLISQAPNANTVKEIWACGYTLISLIRENENYLRERLLDGCVIKLMIMDPKCEASIYLNERVTPRPGEFAADLSTSLAHLQELAANMKRNSKGKLELHLMTTVPSYSIVAVDPSKGSGWIQIGLYPNFHGIPLDISRPHVVFTRSDGQWFKFFRKQIESLWSDPTYSIVQDLKTK